MSQNGSVESVAELRCPAPAHEVRAVVADLNRYPEWLDIVARVAPVGPANADATAPPDGPTWMVDLRAAVGPFRRTKRLHMVQTLDEPDHVRFERRERDGRRHSAWVLDVGIVGLSDDASTLTMTLHYGGSLWVPMLDGLLAQEIERSRPRLAALLAR